MAPDFPSTFEEESCMKMVGFDMTAAATKKLFEKTMLKPRDVDVIVLHDCFSANELINYEALGLCPLGKAGEMIDNGDNTYGGKYVVNPSGGLISKVSRFYKHNYLKKNMPCFRTISNVLSS